MAGNLNLRNHFFGLNKQEILIRHEQLINDGHAEGNTQVGPENVQDIMRVIDPENTQKGIGSSDIILGEDVRDILENDNFIVAEIIKNWGDAQGKGLKTFKLSTDPDQAVDDMGLINAPRVFVGNKQVIEHIMGQSQRNTDEAQALIDFAETQYIADEVLASHQWQDLSRAEKIFHIIARYAFLGQDNPHTRIIQLLFGDYNHQLDQAVEEEDEDEDEDEDGGASKKDGPPRQKRRKKRGGRKTRRKRKTRKRKAGMPPKNTTRDRLRKKLLEKQQKQLQKIGVANYQRDTSFMRHMVSPEIKKRLTDMKNAGIDPQTAYDQLKEEYALNQFLNEVSISKAKREAETTDDKMAKIQGDLLQLKEEQKKINRQTKKDRAKRKKANKKKKKKAISNLLNQPPGSGKPIKWDEDIMHMDTGGEGSDRMYSREGGRRKKTRKMKGGHHLYKRLGVSKYASQKQIKKAYNKLKKKKKLTKKVKHAYKILSKKKTRKQYNNRYRKVMKHKRHTRKKRGGNVWDLKKEYDNIMNNYDHTIFWIDNAHKGQWAARNIKNIFRRIVGKKKPTQKPLAVKIRNEKLKALKKKAWKLCKPDMELHKKIKDNLKVAKEGEGNLTLELQNGEFVDIEPKNIWQPDRPNWNDWTTKLMDEFKREQYRLEAKMHKSGLYGVCDIYNKINEILGEDKDKENNPLKANQQASEAAKQRRLQKMYEDGLL